MDGYFGMSTHLGHFIAVAVSALLLTLVFIKFYRAGAYTKTGLILALGGLYVAAGFMLLTLN